MWGKVKTIFRKNKLFGLYFAFSVNMYGAKLRLFFDNTKLFLFSSILNEKNKQKK